MADYLVVFRLRTDGLADHDALRRLIEDVYFPAMHDGPTRAGMVMETLLLGGEAENEGGDYWLHVRWDGIEPRLNWVLPNETSEAGAQLAALGVTPEHIGSHRILAARQSAF